MCKDANCSKSVSKSYQVSEIPKASVSAFDFIIRSTSNAFKYLSIDCCIKRESHLHNDYSIMLHSYTAAM